MRWIRALLAALAIIAAAVAVAVLAAAAAGGETLGALWHSLAPESVNLVQAAVQRYLHPGLWSHVILPVLLAPSLVVFAAAVAAALALWLLVRRLAGSG